MEQPTYLRRLLKQKTLLIIGFVVALVAGLLAGFTIVDGQIEPRAARTFTASSTILLTSPQPQYFQTEIPETTQALPQPQDPAQPAQELIVQAATPLDLADSAIILAYMASSDEIADAVEEAVGGFEEGDAITAVRRTTQPAGDERFGGRLTLPIIDIVGTAGSAARAESIATEATAAFAALVEDQQIEWGVAEDIRLTLDELNVPVADSGEGSNPAIPVIVVTVGVFLLFIAAALIIEAIRDRRRRAEAAADADDEDADAAEPTEGTAGDQTQPEGELVSASARRSARRRAGAADVHGADSPDPLSDDAPRS